MTRDPILTPTTHNTFIMLKNYYWISTVENYLTTGHSGVKTLLVQLNVLQDLDGLMEISKQGMKT